MGDADLLQYMDEELTSVEWSCCDLRITFNLSLQGHMTTDDLYLEKVESGDKSEWERW